MLQCYNFVKIDLFENIFYYSFNIMTDKINNTGLFSIFYLFITLSVWVCAYFNITKNLDEQHTWIKCKLYWGLMRTKHWSPQLKFNIRDKFKHF